MTDTNICSRCGAALASGDSNCPRCLLELGRAAPKSAAADSGETSSPAKRRAALSLEEIAAHFPELEFDALIGEGGMGAVYKARQPKIDRTVALKVLGFDPLDNPSFAERFRREAMVLAKLDHPHIVKLYDFGERDGLFYLVLEFVDGTNLRTLMKQELVTPKVALAIVPQLCEALQYAHDEGVVHRDIKPENVLVDSKGRAKIADFGLAKLVDANAADRSLTEVGQVMGTPHYMAPEQLRGSRDVDHRADIYSLGVVFYEMLTGELPRGNFELPSKSIHVDVKLDAIVLKSLERTPERRYQHAIEVKTDVESFEDANASGKSHLKSFVESLAERAKAAAAKDVAEGRASVVHVGRQKVLIYPNRSWHFFLFYLALWPVVGAAFNGGTGWLIAALCLMSAGFWSHMQQHSLGDRELDRSLRSERRDVIAARHLTAMVLLFLAFAALYYGHVSMFEQVSAGYRSSPSDLQSMFDLPNRLLPVLESRGTLTWTGVDRSRVTFQQMGFDALDREGLLHQPWLLFIAAALFLATAIVYGSRWSDLARWRGWRMPIRATVALFGSLVAIHLVCALVYASHVEPEPLTPIVRDAPLELAAPNTGSNDVVDHLRTKFLLAGYQVNTLGTWTYVERGSSTPPRSIRIGFADPSDVSDRWRLSWQGPERRAPHVVFVVRGAALEGASNVQFDLGDAAASTIETANWIEKHRAFVSSLATP